MHFKNLSIKALYPLTKGCLIQFKNNQFQFIQHPIDAPQQVVFRDHIHSHLTLAHDLNLTLLDCNPTQQCLITFNTANKYCQLWTCQYNNVPIGSQNPIAALSNSFNDYKEPPKKQLKIAPDQKLLESNPSFQWISSLLDSDNPLKLKCVLEFQLSNFTSEPIQPPKVALSKGIDNALELIILMNNELCVYQIVSQVESFEFELKLVYNSNCLDFLVLPSHLSHFQRDILILVSLSGELQCWLGCGSEINLPLHNGQLGVTSLNYCNDCTIHLTLISGEELEYKFDYFDNMQPFDPLLNKLIFHYKSNIYFTIMANLIQIKILIKNLNFFDALELSILALFELDYPTNYEDQALSNWNRCLIDNASTIHHLMLNNRCTALDVLTYKPQLHHLQMLSKTISICALDPTDHRALQCILHVHQSFNQLKRTKLNSFDVNLIQSNFNFKFKNMWDCCMTWLSTDHPLDAYSVLTELLGLDQDELRDMFHHDFLNIALQSYIDFINEIKAIVSEPNHLTPTQQVMLDGLDMAMRIYLVHKHHLKYTTLTSQQLIEHRIQSFNRSKCGPLPALDPGILRLVERSIDYFNLPDDTLDMSKLYDHDLLKVSAEIEQVEFESKKLSSAPFARAMIYYRTGAEVSELPIEICNKVKFQTKSHHLKFSTNWLRFTLGFGRFISSKTVVDFRGIPNPDAIKDRWMVGGELVARALAKQLHLDLSQIYSLLLTKHVALEVGVLLGLGVQHLGTKQASMTQLLGLYIPPLDNTLLASEFNRVKNDIQNLGSVNYLTQSCALTSIGLMYVGARPKLQFLEPLLQRLSLRATSFIISEAIQQNCIILGSGIALGLTQIPTTDSPNDWDIVSNRLYDLWMGASSSNFEANEDAEFQMVAILIAMGFKYGSKSATHRHLISMFDISDYQKTTCLVLFIKGVFHYLMQLSSGVHFDQLAMPPSLRTYQFDDVLKTSANSKFFFKLKACQWFAIGLKFSGSRHPQITTYLTAELKLAKAWLFQHGNHGKTFAELYIDYLFVLVALALVEMGTYDPAVSTELLRMKGLRACQFVHQKLIDAALGLLHLGGGCVSLENSPLSQCLLTLMFFPATHRFSNDELQVFPEPLRLLALTRPDPQRLMFRDLDSGNLMRLNVIIQMLPIVPTDDIVNLELTAPCNLPDLKFVKSIRLNHSEELIIHSHPPNTNEPTIKITHRDKECEVVLNGWSYVNTRTNSTTSPTYSLIQSNTTKLDYADHFCDYPDLATAYFHLHPILTDNRVTKDQLDLLAKLRPAFQSPTNDAEFQFKHLLTMAHMRMEQYFNENVSNKSEREFVELRRQYNKMIDGLAI